MSNHVLDVIESIRKNGGTPHRSGIGVKQDRESWRDYESMSSQPCFDMGGDNEKLEFDSNNPELMRLPYPGVWFEGRVGNRLFAASAVERQVIPENKDYKKGNAFLSIFEYRKDTRQWLYHCYAWWGVEEFNGGDGSFNSEIEPISAPMWIGNDQDETSDAIQDFFDRIKSTVAALNCTNVNRIEHKPPEKLQKARVKRGKQPLFSYWTLEIDLPKSRVAGEDYGGTHASPRLHLRRGHPRQYAPGKYCWVQPCVVGNKAAGMVHKDYAVKHAA